MPDADFTYETVAGLKSRVPARELENLTDHDGSLQAVDDEKVLDALLDATAQINSFVQRRATLPLENPPRVLEVFCRDIAMYRLHVSAGRVTDDVEKQYKAAIAWLRDVADGKVSLGDDDPEDTVPATPGAVFTEGAGPVMTRDTLKGF